MQYIDPRVYIDMNDTAIKQLYDNIEEMTSFKDFVVCAVDASIIEIPNVPLTREEFEIPENTKLESYKSSARISCMVDTQKDFVLSSNISYKDMSELEHAIFHLKEVSNKLDLTKTITVYDRGYNATEIMLLTTLLDSYFVIRAKKSIFKKQQEKMKINDETFKISLNNSKINRFHNNELKEYARILKSMKIRIVKVKLNNGTTETLLTNIPEQIAQPSELKELYGDRWTVEKDFDRLKNKLQIEKFTGRKKIRVEQDFYSNIFIFNTLMAIKNDAEQNITRTPRENNKHEYQYKSNINRLIGEIKEQMPALLNNDKEEVQKNLLKVFPSNLTLMDVPVYFQVMNLNYLYN